MVVGWDKLVLQGNVARTAREEAQRKDSGVDRHHHFIGRQKRALIRSRSNRDVGAGDQGNLSPGALENRKVWVSEWSVPGKGKRQCPTPGFWTSSLHGPLPWPRPSFLACLTQVPVPVPGLFDPVPPTPYLSGARVLKVTSCAGDRAGRGEKPRGGGEPRGPAAQWEKRV